MVALLAYFVYYMLTVNIIFSPMDFAWLYNPYEGYREDPDSHVFVSVFFSNLPTFF
jgi:hypothetical protein